MKHGTTLAAFTRLHTDSESQESAKGFLLPIFVLFFVIDLILFAKLTP